APAQPVRRRLGFLAGRGAEEAVVDPAKRRMHRRGADPVKPGAAVLRPRLGEGRARQLLGIKPAWRLLRRVLTLRQYPGDRLALLFVAEAREIFEARALGHAALMHLSDLDPRIRAHYRLLSDRG